ncbi:MAG: tetratricopeptide repeat protein [Bacteroidales bacterium]|nr:tetratricopeptide repeat protein [Bacteroidales bacterium]
MDKIKDIEKLIHDSISNRYSNSKESHSLAVEILKKSKRQNFIKGIAYAHCIIGFTNQIMHKSENVINHLLDAISFFENNKNEQGYSLTANSLSNYYDILGDYEKALKYANDGYNAANKYNFKEIKADLLSTIGILHSRIADYKHALNSHKKALGIRKKLNLIHASASSLNLIARTNLFLKNFNESEINYKKSIELRNKHNDKGGLIWSYIGIASLYEETNDLLNAENYYLKANEINNAINDLRAKFQIYKGIGKIYCLNDKTNRAWQYLEPLLSIAKELNSKPFEYQAHYALSSYYEKTNHPKESLFHINKYIELKEEVINSETQNKIAQQKAEFEIVNAKQEAEIFQLRNVELKSAYDEIEEKNKSILASINYAKHIQDAILPRKQLIDTILPNSFLLFMPKDIVSGDFYWVLHFNEKVFFAAVDCTGHGVPGAMLSMIGTNILNQAVREKGIEEPGKILEFLSLSISVSLHQTKNESGSKDGMDIAICVYDTKKMLIEYAGAYNPIYHISDGELFEIKGDKIAIGGELKDDKRKYSNHKISVKPTDVIYIFSDGYADQFGGPDDRKFKYKPLKELLLKIHTKEADEQKFILEKTFINWKGENEQIDDVILIGVKI